MDEVKTDTATEHHSHCWHSFGIVYDSYPMAGTWKCCHCGEVFTGRENELPNSIHGPFKPNQYE